MTRPYIYSPTTARKMNPAALGRADLIRWADSLDEARLRRLAEGLGYKEEPEVAPQASAGRAPADATQAAPPPIEGPATDGARHRHYRLVERRPLAPPPPPSPLAAARVPDEEPVAPLGPAPPLVPWPRLWPLLRAALGERAERHRIDLPRVVAAVSRARPLRRLPRLKGLRWAPRGQLILDLHPRLYPFWNDFNALKDALPRLRGAAGLAILRLDEGPAGAVQPWDGRAWGPPRPYAPPPAGTPVLIAGDLGCLGSPGQRQAWVGFGRRLVGAGVLPVALTPCPARWWDPALAGLFYPVTLDRAAHIPPKPTGPCPWPAQPVDLADAARSDPGARRLLTLLSASIAIRPALLRHLRYALPVGVADVGSEAAAWLHPAYVAGDFALLPGDPVEVERLRAAFRETGTARERALAWGLIRAQQGTDATKAERMEERALYAALQGRGDPAAEAFLDRVAAALSQSRAAGAGEHARFLAAWVNRRAARMHPAAWAASPRSEALWLLAHPEAEGEGAPLPAGLDLHRALAALGRPEESQDWRLVQRGEGFEVEPWPEAKGDFATGSPIVERFSTRRPIVQVRENRPAAPERSLPLAAGAGLPLAEAGWRLRTPFEELVVEPFARPAWAHTLGRDGDGLFVGFNDGLGERRAYWCSPGRGYPQWLGPPQPPPGYLGIDIEDGFFLDEAQYRVLRDEGLYPGYFADSLAIDDHGIRGELTIKGPKQGSIIGVKQGFRWIWPGRFPMGSPEGESGRYDDERQHEVILTRGFWLAETACTQALWQAVMGENPSYAKGGQRPVMNVSWDEVQRFMERLNAAFAGGPAVGQALTRPGAAAGEAEVGLKLGLRFRLPSEAEWEYACRAGTTTAYSFGDTFDSRRANVGFQTVDVGSLPPNPWGLYEMHGNVWEWCQDWYGGYPADPVPDPVGPATGVERVLRGGGWIDVGRYLRSASRYRYLPGDRYVFIGFRLALGPEPRQDGQGRTGKAGQERGRTARAGSDRQGADGAGGLAPRGRSKHERRGP